MKPFLKWAGGKTQLLKKIEERYYIDKSIKKYYEPFLGGGAILFDILEKKDFEYVVANDINKKLIITYNVVKNNVEKLYDELLLLKDDYKNSKEKEKYYYRIRSAFNKSELEDLDLALMFIFLNKTGFNGLHRVNKNGNFNVPFGKREMFSIPSKEDLLLISKSLGKVVLTSRDYKENFDFIDDTTFIYADPPYRPINKSSFKSYSESSFNDKEQNTLKVFLDYANKRGAKFLLSNSNTNDGFFQDLYKEYNIEEVDARRNINSNGKKRGTIKEILIRNF